jgi:hypothetical protein
MHPQQNLGWPHFAAPGRQWILDIKTGRKADESPHQSSAKACMELHLSHRRSQYWRLDKSQGDFTFSSVVDFEERCWSASPALEAD